jgi:hypothetical protein
MEIINGQFPSYDTDSIENDASNNFYVLLSFPKLTRGLEPIGYRGALVSTVLHANVYT